MKDIKSKSVTLVSYLLNCYLAGNNQSLNYYIKLFTYFNIITGVLFICSMHRLSNYQPFYCCE